jgi:hypothetical protein
LSLFFSFKTQLQFEVSKESVRLTSQSHFEEQLRGWLFLFFGLIFVAVRACVLAARANIINTFIDKARHDDYSFH